MKNYKKIIAAVLVIAIVASCAVGATLAWLQDKTQEVKNTFTTSNVDITLTETGAVQDGDTENQKKEYKMVPGTVLSKDPKVTVVAGSEACYVFVKVEAKNVAGYLEYTVDASWKELENGVYYKEVDADTANAGVVYNVLTGNVVKVSNSVTNEQMNAAKTNVPELKFTAYAVQKENVASADAAWDIAQGLVTE